MKGTIRTRLRRSLDTTFALYVVETLLAGGAASLVANTLARHLGETPAETMRRGILFEGLNALAHARETRILAAGLGVAVLLELLLVPLLAMVWTIALVDGVPLVQAVKRAPRLYLPALLGRVLAFGTSLPFLAVALVLPAVAHLALSRHPDVSTHDLAVLASALPCLAVALLASTFTDLLELALVVDGPRVLEAWLLGLRALGARVLAESFATRALRLLAATAAAGVVTVAGPGLLGGMLALAASQLLLLGSRLLRAAWLARGIERLEEVR